MATKRNIWIDGQPQEGVWYDKDTAILKVGGWWQAVEATITTKEDEKVGESGRLIGFPCRSIKECQEIINKRNAGRIEDAHVSR